MTRRETNFTRRRRRGGVAGRCLMAICLGSTVGFAGMLDAARASEPANAIAGTASTALALGTETANEAVKFLGALMFYDPVQDLAGAIDEAPFGPGDRAWVEAALAVYDLYRQIGGEAGTKRYLFKRAPNRVFVGVEGGSGHWHESVSEGQAAFLRLLARSSRTMPESLRLAALLRADQPLGPVVKDLAAALAVPDKILLISPGGTRSLRLDDAWQVVATSGLAVSGVPNGDGGMVASITRAAGEIMGPQAVLAFPKGRRFTASNTIEVAIDSETVSSPTADAGPPSTAAAAAPQRLDPVNNAPISDRITTSGETRRYMISIPSTGDYKIVSTGPSDIVGSLKDPTGAILAGDDDGGSGYNFSLEAALEPGDYTLEVAHCCAGTGFFTLKVVPK
jgi:hypothetical protein